MSSTTYRPSKHVLAEIEGHPYQFHDGGKHWKLYVYGKMVGVFPKGPAKGGMNGKGWLNVRSQIRRCIRETEA